MANSGKGLPRSTIDLAERVTALEEGEGGGGAVAWADVTGVPAALTTAAAAATPSIRAIGTTATTALAGNTAIPAAATTAPAAPAAAAAVGTGTTFARNDHVHARQTGAQVSLTGYVAVTASPVAAADTVNAAIAKLEARIAALETP